MNNAVVTDSATRQFAAAVKEFTPKASAKFQALLPFKDGISELRRKHASYVIIASILRNINVAVSHDTVARFCHEVLGITRTQRRPRKSQAAGGSRKSHRPPSPNASTPTTRGPRVADPNNI